MKVVDPSPPFTSAIIVAAGRSRRMGFDKLTASLGGLPVLHHTITAFLNCPAISEIIVVTDELRFDKCCPTHLPKPVTRVCGGTERHHSVAAGIAACHAKTEFIAVHDGARPFITPQSIQLCLKAAQKTGAAACAHPITDTVKRADSDGNAATSIDRTDLWGMETPQIFRTHLIKQAYKHVLEQKQLVTDEVSAMEAIGIKTKLVSHPAHNQKITFPSDLSG